MTDRAIEVIEKLDHQPWCMHLSYIKPHWPYMAPSPYNAMYSKMDVLPAIRDLMELEQRHPVVEAFAQHEESINFSRQDCRETVIPAYMGLITELDYHIGRLIDFLRVSNLLENTVIVLTSDHGDYLGDHWLGEKELFFESAIKIPMIVVDPSSSSDPTRGTRVDEFAESIDLLPTFMELGGCSQLPDHWLEGRSLVPLMRGRTNLDWRDAVFCESDYAMRHARNSLSRKADECRAFMVRNKRWKYVFFDGFGPQLFDLDNDPLEFKDLGSNPDYIEVREALFKRLFKWMSQRKLRTTLSNQEIAGRTGSNKKRGYFFGVW